MFFRRKEPQRNVHAGELKTLKDQEFERKIGDALSYSNDIIVKLERSMNDFKELCENFALENSAVDNELIGNVSNTTLASQKEAYVKAVLSIVNSTNAYKSAYATHYDLVYEKKSNFEGYRKGNNSKVNLSTLNRYMREAIEGNKGFLGLYSQTR